MDPRELLSLLRIPQSLSLESLYNTSLPILVGSTLICIIISYSIAKMLGFGSRNEFLVEGQVCAKMHNGFKQRSLSFSDRAHHRWL